MWAGPGHQLPGVLRGPHNGGTALVCKAHLYTIHSWATWPGPSNHLLLVTRVCMGQVPFLIPYTWGFPINPFLPTL